MEFKIDESSMEYAEKLEKEKDWTNALVAYKNILLIKPEDIKIIEKIGWCYSRLEQYHKAIEAFKELITREPKKAKWDYMVGYQYYSMKEWNIAIEFFRTSLTKYPNYFIVKYRLGYALTQTSGKIQRLKSPNYLEAFKLFSECELLWNKMSDVEKNREKQHYADICFQKSKILLERSDWDGSINSIRKSIDIDKNNPDYSYILSKALCSKGEYEEALKVIPNGNKYYINELRAEIYSKLNDVDRAIDLYTRLLKTRDRDYLHRLLGEEYIKKNDLPNAFINIQKSIKLNPKNHKNYFAMGKLYYVAGLLILAKSELEKAIMIKQNEYNCDYIEANDLLNEINNEIQLKNVENDDINILKKLKKNIVSDIIKGKVKKYVSERGFGFIKDREKEFYFHISDVYQTHQKNVCEGADVTFSIQESTKGPVAKQIKVVANL
ncbi:Cold-shock protein DNA-binding [Ruminiclostridium papyrosolvens DSM 2782]|uniref:Cold-shock protein DNA-binding n=1 Tax=Ruminiclostridium papyrosolvens DSM 2782 TaxID=588581 RepID=F1TFM5_9FIRM|nr:cold shock domain-containing protein [Ruminiclostridium papyrosolvens]EGD46757.1 Cold-shock protein DNA-binding [Ruminiclostridium papyrosolvens DSM 2782]WES34902.1 cold shock domain-containing protein [Ruminiclostridium papyrosolvens DSM 2782]